MEKQTNGKFTKEEETGGYKEVLQYYSFITIMLF